MKLLDAFPGLSAFALRPPSSEPPLACAMIASTSLPPSLEDIGLGPRVGGADAEARNHVIHGMRPLALGGGFERLDLAVCQGLAGHARFPSILQIRTGGASFWWQLSVGL